MENDYSVWGTVGKPHQGIFRRYPQIVQAIGEDIGENRSIEIIVLMADKISDATNARSIDIRRQLGAGGRIDFMHANRRLADDKELTLYSTAHQKIVIDCSVNPTGLIDPFPYKIGGSHHIAEALGNAVRRHLPGLSG